MQQMKALGIQEVAQLKVKMKSHGTLEIGTPSYKKWQKKQKKLTQKREHKAKIRLGKNWKMK